VVQVMGELDIDLGDRTPQLPQWPPDSSFCSFYLDSERKRRRRSLSAIGSWLLLDR